MSETTNPNTELPTAIRHPLEHFCNQLRTALADELVAVILFGDAVRRPESLATRINVMIVLQSMSVASLDKLTSPIQHTRKSIGIAPLILTEEDLQSSTDVFPIKFINMQRHHRVLLGRDVLSELIVGVEHLRLRCEQEVKNLMLRLRSFYVHNSHHSEALRETLKNAASSLTTCLSALLILKKEPVPDNDVELVNKAGELMSLDMTAVRNVLELDEQPAIDETQNQQLYDEFMATVRSTAKMIDGFDSDSRER